MSNRRLRIAILGYSRAGKDTAGIWLGEHTPLRYAGSASEIVCPLIAADLGISEEEAWKNRHIDRQFWFTWCNEFRRGDPTRLARVALEKGDICVGLRDQDEVAACVDLGLFDLTVWISSTRVPADPTVTFTSSDCDVSIDNSGSVAQFHKKLNKFCHFASIPVYEEKESCLLSLKTETIPTFSI